MIDMNANRHLLQLQNGARRGTHEAPRPPQGGSQALAVAAEEIVHSRRWSISD